MSTTIQVTAVDFGVADVLCDTRLDVVVDGLPFFGSVRFAIDGTLLPTLHCDGRARTGTDDVDGAAFTATRRRNGETYRSLWVG